LGEARDQIIDIFDPDQIDVLALMPEFSWFAVTRPQHDRGTG